MRWLRPDYQNPSGSTKETQAPLPGTEPAAVAAVVREKSPWPKTLPEQVAAVRAALARHAVPVSARTLKEQFKNAREPKVLEILAALASIGQARETGDGLFVC